MRLAWLVGSMADQRQVVGRRYHHANQAVTIAGDPLPLRMLRPGARLGGPTQDQAI